MSSISTHVLDTARGRAAAGVAVTLERLDEDSTIGIGEGTTDQEGRIRDLMTEGHDLVAGRYRLTFDTASYFGAQNVKGFYPQVVVIFQVRDAGEHHHVPLLLSPHGYSTYRGS